MMDPGILRPVHGFIASTPAVSFSESKPSASRPYTSESASAPASASPSTSTSIFAYPSASASAPASTFAPTSAPTSAPPPSSIRRTRIYIPLQARYVPGSGPPLPPLRLLPPHDSTAYIKERLFLPSKGLAANGRPLPKRMMYLVGWRDLPAATTLVPAMKVLDYVSPYVLEQWEERVEQDKEDEQARLEAEKRAEEAAVAAAAAAAAAAVEPTPTTKAIIIEAAAKRKRGRPPAHSKIEAAVVAEPETVAKAKSQPKRGSMMSLVSPQKKRLRDFEAFDDDEDELARNYDDDDDTDEEDAEDEDQEMELNNDDGLADQGDEGEEDEQIFFDAPASRGSYSEDLGPAASAPPVSARTAKTMRSSQALLMPMQGSHRPPTSMGGAAAAATAATAATNFSAPRPTSAPPFAPFSASPANPAPRSPATTSEHAISVSRSKHPDNHRHRHSLEGQHLHIRSRANQVLQHPQQAQPLRSQQPLQGSQVHKEPQQQQCSHPDAKTLPSLRYPNHSPSIPRPKETPVPIPKHGIPPKKAPIREHQTTLPITGFKPQNTPLPHGNGSSSHRPPEERNLKASSSPTSTERPLSEPSAGMPPSASKRRAAPQDEWLVERLEEVRYLSDPQLGIVREFKVRWEGDWPPDQKTTWEPEDNIPRDMVRQFMKAAIPRKKKHGPAGGGGGVVGHSGITKPRPREKQQTTLTWPSQRKYSSVTEAFAGDDHSEDARDLDHHHRSSTMAEDEGDADEIFVVSDREGLP